MKPCMGEVAANAFRGELPCTSSARSQSPVSIYCAYLVVLRLPLTPPCNQFLLCFKEQALVSVRWLWATPLRHTRIGPQMPCGDRRICSAIRGAEERHISGRGLRQCRFSSLDLSSPHDQLTFALIGLLAGSKPIVITMDPPPPSSPLPPLPPGLSNRSSVPLMTRSILTRDLRGWDGAESESN